ncbi:MAG: BMP family ABC transporter substrate-binding protein [Eubacteriaceae bacterium]|nr:BMP family ABC transporter substrate-binding protein [Eubacteriaceae bacterium]
MKKLLTLLMVALMVCSFVACGGGEENPTYEIALITDVGNIDDRSFNQGSWEGVVAYAKANNKTYAYYRPSEDTAASRLETIGTAIDGGAKVVVCPGFLFEDVIYDAQDQYPETQFLLIDGEPHTADYSAFKTGNNVHCIKYQEEQSGWFAGYAAVMDGYRKLGFLGGIDVDPVKRYGYGYVQGAEAAAKELGLAAGDVTIKYSYAMSFDPSDDIKVKVSGWYSDGVEIVFSCGGDILESVIGAAQEATNGAKIIGVDTDQSAISDLIVTSAFKLLPGSVELSLTELYKNNGVWPEAYAGKTIVLGASTNSVGLPTEAASWKLANFTVEQYNAVYAKVLSGEIAISNVTTEAPAVTLVSVDYQQ